MNDFETMKKMLTGKVDFKILDEGNLKYYSREFLEQAGFGIEVQNSDGDCKLGYKTFTGLWLFDENGMFLAVGHYE